MSGRYEVRTEEHRHDPGYEHRDHWTAEVKAVSASRRAGYGRGKSEPAAIRAAVDNLFEVREDVRRPRP